MTEVNLQYLETGLDKHKTIGTKYLKEVNALAWKGEYPKNCYNPKDYWKGDAPLFYPLRVKVEIDWEKIKGRRTVNRRTHYPKQRKRANRIDIVHTKTGNMFHSVDSVARFLKERYSKVYYHLTHKTDKYPFEIKKRPMKVEEWK